MPPDSILEIGPFRGAVSVREKIALKPDEVNGVDSSEWMFSPEDGRAARRGGTAVQADTWSAATAAGHEVAGFLESKWGARSQQFIPLRIPSISDLQESAAWLVCNESTLTGTVAWMDRDLASGAGGPNNLGRTDFNQGATGHYRQDGAAGEVRMKCIPGVAEAGGIDYWRFNSITNRKYPGAGSRRTMQTDRGLILPGVPYWWNGRRNVSATSGTEKMRGRPWGLDPAYWAPTSAFSANIAEASSNWKGGNRFYEAWRFVYASGAKGPLFRISTSQTTVARGGLITVGTAAQFYLSRTISGIPLGPLDGPEGPCVAREGFRSLQSETADPLPDFSAMYGFMRIEDNTSTSAVDYFGSDDSLATPASDLTNQTWPRRGQVAVSVEGRAVIAGKLRRNPFALIIGPCGAGASRDLNLPDTNTTGLYGSTGWYHARITSGAAGHLYLTKTTSGAPNTTATLDIDFATYTTLQAVSDKINETLFGDTTDEWFCQIAPGVDGNELSQYLRTTSDTGDDGVSTSPAGSLTGTVRVYCPTFHFVAAFTEAYLATFPTDETGLWLSDGNPGGSGGHSVFRIRPGDRKQPGADTGKFVMIEPCTAPGGVCAIVFYERKKYALVNTKGGGSLDNADYVLRLLDGAAGCISHKSCGNGPGYAYCVDQAGVWCGDGNYGSALRPFRDHYDEHPAPGQLEGELAFAIRTDSALQGAGSDTYTWAGIVGDKLRVRCRGLAVASTYQDLGIDYWFGKSKYASGLASLQKEVDGNLTSFGTSCTNRKLKVGVHGSVTTPGVGTATTPADNRKRIYAWQDTDDGTTGSGCVQEVDMPSVATDNGVAFVSEAFTACVMSEEFGEIGIKEVDPAWRKNGSGLTITIWGDLNRSTVLALLTLGTSGSSVVKRQTFKLGTAARGNLQCCEMKIADDGTGTGAVEVRSVPTKIRTHSAATRYA